MAMFSKVVLSCLALGAALFVGNFLFGKTPKTPVIKSGWFGRGPRRTDQDKSIIPFTIDVEDSVLEDLQHRLESARLGEDLENVRFEYGFQVNYMKEVLEYWENTYDWRQHEDTLNQFPQFKTNIEGIDVHFIHVKPKNPTGAPRPLLMTHGWPGSVWEFYKILPMLTDPAAFGGKDEDAFEVICPSIPGYGFSEAAHQTGMNAMAAGRIFVELMERLGHKSFYVQGGDWGALISTCISQAYPEKTRGIHLNMFTPPKSGGEMMVKQLIGSYFPSLLGISEWEHKLAYPLSKLFVKLMATMGYMHLQATKPDTVAFALNDSPVGLAAYVMEKFGGWTNAEKHLNSLDGAITEKFTLDEVLTNVMIYWVTGSIGSSMRFYRENLAGSEEMDSWDSVKVTVPAGLAAFPNDLVVTPRALAEIRFKNITQHTEMSRGGHFAALEEPRMLADDIFSFVKKVERK